MGMSFEMMKLDIFKGVAAFMAVIFLWMQIYIITQRYMTAKESLKVPGAMSVYLGTKCMFFTYFFLELMPFTRGEDALTGNLWNFAAAFFSISLWYNWLKTHNEDPGYLGTARCAFFGRNLHSRMPLDPTHVRLKRTRL
jgi:hypothetical protein